MKLRSLGRNKQTNKQRNPLIKWFNYRWRQITHIATAITLVYRKVLRPEAIDDRISQLWNTEQFLVTGRWRILAVGSICREHHKQISFTNAKFLIKQCLRWSATHRVEWWYLRCRFICTRANTGTGTVLNALCNKQLCCSKAM